MNSDDTTAYNVLIFETKKNLYFHQTNNTIQYLDPNSAHNPLGFQRIH